MAIEETNILKKIMLALSPKGCCLFRNNRGLFMTLDGKRKVRAGLEIPGASDLIGYTKLTITPEMVGKPIAVFTVVEGKTKLGRASDDQNQFVSKVCSDGGIGLMARSDHEALEGWSDATERYS